MGTPLTDDVLSVRVISALPSANPLRWANTYEVQRRNLLAVLTEADLITLATLFQTAHRAHMTDVAMVERVVVSTYVPDGGVYSPVTFATFPFDSFGVVSNSTTLLPLSNVLFVERKTALGRAGRMFVRGVLGEANITSSGGMADLTAPDRTAWNSSLNLAFVELLPGGASPWKLVMASGLALGLPTSVRDVTALHVRGITAKKLNNKYFDRA